LRDLRKSNGTRDHIVFELNDRELFADFIIEYAYQEEDEIYFELIENFSMIVNASPVWFSFQDIEKSKQLNTKKQFKTKELRGFLEIR
jgi:hypothetical protein